MASNPIWIECKSDAYKAMKKFGGKKEVTFDIFCGTSVKNSNLAGKVTISLKDSAICTDGHSVDIQVTSEHACISTDTETLTSVVESCRRVNICVCKDWDKDWKVV